MKTCECCGGSGMKLDHSHVGSNMRKLRRSKRLSLRSVADKMGFSAPYLSDLERGRRNWNTELIKEFKATCQ